MRKIFGEFKTFISKGNVIDLAVGLIMGTMFTNIVNSIVKDIFMPFISLLTGNANFDSMYFVLKVPENVDISGMTAEAAVTAGASIVNYGNLIQLIITFLLTAICLFLLVKGMNTLREAGEKRHKKDAETETVETEAAE